MSGKTTVQARDPNKLNSGYFQSHDTAARPVHFRFGTGSACSKILILGPSLWIAAH